MLLGGTESWKQRQGSLCLGEFGAFGEGRRREGRGRTLVMIWMVLVNSLVWMRYPQELCQYTVYRVS